MIFKFLSFLELRCVLIQIANLYFKTIIKHLIIFINNLQELVNVGETWLKT